MSGSTAEPAYAQRLDGLQQRRIARWFDVQRPYRHNIRRLEPGYVLDVGCGLGRNLAHLDGDGIGIDHNPESVRIARARGLRVFTPDEFRSSGYDVGHTFDSMLLAHVVEHLTPDAGRALVDEHRDLVKPGGRVILICPQRAGYRSDETHVTYYDRDGLRDFASSCGLTVASVRSFPFPRPIGAVFPYNETVLVANLPR